MSFFRKDPPAPPEDITSEEYRTLMKTLGKLEAEVETLQTKWSMWLDQANRILARLDKRVQREKAKAEESNEPPEPVEYVDPVTAAIRARRAGNGIPGRV